MLYELDAYWIILVEKYVTIQNFVPFDTYFSLKLLKKKINKVIPEFIYKKNYLCLITKFKIKKIFTQI